MLTKEERKEKKELTKELLFFLDNYKEVSPRGQQIKDYFDDKISDITEKLKQIGK